MSKQYGLITTKKKSNLPFTRPSVFGSDSDSDDHNIPTAAQQNVVRRQDLVAQQKALEEDPSVYQYDEIYDKMETKKAESKLARKDLDKKPKYINRLLASAARRKRESELRIERQVQRERVAEGEQFKDKEEFVTTAYRQKLEELRKLEEEEQREEYLESIGDVRKQGDLDGFYRHLYEQQVKHEDDKLNEPETKIDDKQKNKTRKYRKRNNSDENDSGDDVDVDVTQKQHLPSNLDADSDFSIESSDSGDENNTKPETSTKVSVEVVKTENIDKTDETSVKKLDKSDDKLEFEPDCKENTSPQTPPPEKKPKIDIWKKRTVGDVYNAALQRYFERKAARLQSG